MAGARALAVAVSIALGLAGTAAAGEPAISVDNYRTGEVVRHPVPLLRGNVTGPDVGELTVVNESSERDTARLSTPVRGGRFKALAELVPGRNKLVLQAGELRKSLVLRYEPSSSPYVVNAVWMTDSTGATDYQTQREDDPQDFAERLDTAFKLMQTLTAERMHDLGFGRRTFNLEYDERGKVKVHVLRGDHPAATYYAMEQGEWWGHVNDWVPRALPREHAKYAVIAAYTRKDPETGEMLAHTALGGGHLGLFGGGSVFSWPSGLADVQRTFSDTTPVDGKRVHDDSVGRSTIWGLASTTIGATLHEMGHTFGLPHVRERYGVMSRGFDHFNRAFTVIEPPSAARAEPLEFDEAEVAQFVPVSAVILASSRWFEPDARRWSDDDGPRITRLPSGDLVVEAPHGLKCIRFFANDHGVACRDFTRKKRGPKRVKLGRAALRKEIGALTIEVTAVDREGLWGSLWVHRTEAFVTTWRFSSLIAPWGKERFVDVDAERLAELAKDAQAQKPTSSDTAFVDFAHGVPKRTIDVAGYALREIECDAKRKVVVHAGSDDALRVWLNGRLVHENLVLRGSAADQDRFEMDLARGRNVLLVEVSQGGGGWGLFFRLEDERGRLLKLDAKGALHPLD
jgi:hypothetical protein